MRGILFRMSARDLRLLSLGCRQDVWINEAGIQCGAGHVPDSRPRWRREVFFHAHDGVPFDNQHRIGQGQGRGDDDVATPQGVESERPGFISWRQQVWR